MSINATIDGNKYNSIETIEVGGKTIALEQTFKGSQSITENGTYDVGGKAEVVVNVPTETGGGGITPSGNINITTNGTHDVTTYASAVVNVPQTGYAVDDFANENAANVPTFLNNASNVEVNVDRIRPYAFAGLRMVKVTAPITTRIKENAFIDCLYLTEVDAPNVTSLGKSAFKNCSALTKANYPLVTSVGDNGVFHSCKLLSEVNFDSLTSIGQQMFYGCKALQTISLPKVTTVAHTEQFYGCTSLKNVSMPLFAGNVPQNMFKGCTSLEEINLPLATGLNAQGCFDGCTALKKCDFGENFTTLNITTPFNNCTALETVILRYNGVVSAKAGMFSASTNGVTVYVPSAQLSAYQADATWAKTGASGTSNATFVAIEGSEFE